MWRSCPRKWFYSYIKGFRSPSTPSQELGTQIHQEIEDYFCKGEQPKDARAVAALATLPPREDGVVAEGKVRLNLQENVDFVGIVDLVDHRDPKHPKITDHKTTSSFRWMLTPHELALNPQMMSYAHFAMLAHPEAERVTVRHNYIQTRGNPGPRISEISVEPKHIEEQWQSTLRVVQEMEDCRFSCTSAQDVDPKGQDNGHCEAYGGCFHLNRCALAMFKKEEEDEVINPPDAPKVELKGAKALAELKRKTRQKQDAGAKTTGDADSKLERLRKLGRK